MKARRRRRASRSSRCTAAEREKQQASLPGRAARRVPRAPRAAQDGDAVLFTAGPWEPTLQGARRAAHRSSASRCSRATAARGWRFLWVREFPLFEWDAEHKRLGAAPPHVHHAHPRAPRPARERPGARCYAQLYDLVLNGNELGSGSIRIHRPDIQERVMKAIGLTREQAHEKFGFLLDAYRYASPPHGGIGLGPRPHRHADGRPRHRSATRSRSRRPPPPRA